ncbi:AAA family ATPase [Thermophagus xiamenensis]|uniref:Predicted ATPase n=1 Tax=Thermophagus xiamenensis TaxID=385682 RepID=A0A1I1YJK2_9BACT|nr:ATP-binding protein [Thermophagus xiamenensis]SFE19208.1 Predicted ATPase [Thermophagus xiamenensis]
MIISRIKLINWKNFKEIDVPLSGRTFIVGPNASGKSNLLDVFRFLRDIAKAGGGLQNAVLDRGGISKIRCLSARKHPEVEVEIELSEYGSKEVLWKYAIGIKQEVRGYRLPILVYEKVWKKNKLILNRPDKHDENDKERLYQTHLEQINANKEFREIARFLESIVYQHLLPQLLKHPQSFTGPDLPGDPFGKSFLERISKVNRNTRNAWLRKIESALKIAVPQFKQFEFKEENGRPHLEAVYDHWRPSAGKQREDQFSDGTLRLIGLLWSLQEGDSLLLLEEPELSLNGAIVSKIPALIYKLQKPKKRQVLITSHSPDLLSDKGISLDEILVLMPSTEGTTVQPASSLPSFKKMLEGGMTPAQAILPSTKPKDISQLALF